MSSPEEQTCSEGILASIENKANPDQVVSIRYLRAENAFVTSGIQKHFGVKEILIPAHLIVINFELMGAILSAILEKLSRACELETAFSYAASFDVLDRTYTMVEEGEYVKIMTEEGLLP